MYGNSSKLLDKYVKRRVDMENKKIHLKDLIEKVVDDNTKEFELKNPEVFSKLYKEHFYFLITENIYRLQDQAFKSLNDLITNHAHLLIDELQFEEPDNIYYHFANLNESNRKKSKNMTMEGKAAAFKGHSTTESDILPLNSLMEIKFSYNDNTDKKKNDLLESSNTTYKRILSTRPHNINFKQLNEFYTKLIDDVYKISPERKNVYLYLIERDIPFEFFKYILKTYSKLTDESSQFIYKDKGILEKLLKITEVKALHVRKELVNQFTEINNFIDYQYFSYEIHRHKRFTNYCFYKVIKCLNNKTIDDIIVEDKYFQTLYERNDYANTFKVKTDFSAQDFKELMLQIKKYNVEIQKHPSNIRDYKTN